MSNFQILNIVLIDEGNKNYSYIVQSITNASKLYSTINFNSYHIENENQLSEIKPNIVFISTDWILKFNTKWFFHFFNSNNRIKFVILINHSQGNYIKKLLTILNTLPLESNINFIPVDNYSPTIIVQCMMSDLITNC